MFEHEVIIITDKEFRKLGRADLIEIIYQYQKREQALLEENAELRRRLEDRQLRIGELGSIAEASLALNGVFEAAQAAADQYLQNVQEAADEYLKQVRQQTD